MCCDIPIKNKLQPAIDGRQYYFEIKYDFEKKGHKGPHCISRLHKTYHGLRLFPPYSKASPSLNIWAGSVLMGKSLC
jgi:hypothetical protein